MSGYGDPAPARGSRLPRRARRLTALAGAALVLAGAAVVACNPAGHGAPRATPATVAPPSSSPSATGGVPASATASGGPTMEQRAAAARALIGRRATRLGIVVRDRVTGEVWRAGATTHPTWTASTIKLAIATGLLERARAGEVTIDGPARRQLAEMLAASSNDAADALWVRYGRAAMVDRFRTRYGMRGLTFVTGFDRYWGFMKCTAEDLAALMSYILETLDEADRGYLVAAMRAVDPIQWWGVWAAGPALRPGVKGGWSVERDPGPSGRPEEHWVTNTVGFAGDGERYVVAAMYDLPPGTGTLDAGVHAVSDLVATVFGQPTPAPVVIPARD